MSANSFWCRSEIACKCHKDDIPWIWCGKCKRGVDKIIKYDRCGEEKLEIRCHGEKMAADSYYLFGSTFYYVGEAFSENPLFVKMNIYEAKVYNGFRRMLIDLGASETHLFIQNMTDEDIPHPKIIKADRYKEIGSMALRDYMDILLNLHPVGDA